MWEGGTPRTPSYNLRWNKTLYHGVVGGITGEGQRGDKAVGIMHRL